MSGISQIGKPAETEASQTDQSRLTAVGDEAQRVPDHVRCPSQNEETLQSEENVQAYPTDAAERKRNAKNPCAVGGYGGICVKSLKE